MSQSTAAKGHRLSDDELVRRMLENDARAWRAFVARYDRLLVVTITRILTPFSSKYLVDRDEVYALMMASLVRNRMHKLRSFDFSRGTKLSTWLVRLVTHVTWDYLRASQRRRALADALRSVDDQGTEPDAVRILIARQRCERLRELWGELSAGERRAFDLFYVQGAAPDDIAARLGISVKTVYTRNHKLRAKLHAALDDARGVRRRPARRKGAVVRLEGAARRAPQLTALAS